MNDCLIKTQNSPSLSEKFDRIGITEFYNSLDNQGLITHRLGEVWDRLNSDYQTLLLLLVLGVPISINQASKPLVNATLQALEPFDIVSKTNDTVSLSGYALGYYRGVWFFSDAPNPSTTLYFGYDSIGLAKRLEPKNEGCALDLCSGPGIQALILAKSGMKTTSVDINPFATNLCRINACMNSIENRLEILTGNLYDPIESSRRFDLIVANPPLLPIPSNVPYPFVGNGGDDGLDLTVQIISGAKNRLNKHGKLMSIGMTALRNGNFLSQERLYHSLKVAELNSLISVIATYDIFEGSLWVKGLAASSMLYAPDRFESISAAEHYIANKFAEKNVDQVCTYILRAWPSYESRNQITIQYFAGDKDGQDPWRM